MDKTVAALSCITSSCDCDDLITQIIPEFKDRVSMIAYPSLDMPQQQLPSITNQMTDELKINLQ